MSLKSRRIVRWLLLAGLALVLLLSIAVWRLFTPPAIIVSKETTYITEPLRPDGNPDYIAALNRRMSEGVTPENNSAVLFWQAVGPGEIDRQDREKYFELLGTPPLPEKGNYFVPYDKYINRQEAVANATNAEAKQEEQMRIWGQLELAMKRPWSKDEFPILAGWLETNEEAAALLVEASKHPRRFDPLIVEGNGADAGAALPAMNCYRDPARLVVVRAMLRASEAQIDESWDDLLACHRLARLAAQGSFVVDVVTAIGVDRMACQGDIGLLSCNYLKASQITKMRRDLDQLPPMPKMTDKINVAERCVFLDVVLMTARQGLSFTRSWGNDMFPKRHLETGRWKEEGMRKWLSDLPGRALDWNVPLRMGNFWYDRMVEAFGKSSQSQRNAALQAIDEDLAKLASGAEDWGAFGLPISSLIDGRQAASDRIGQLLVRLLLRQLTACAKAEDGAAMHFDLTKLAFALAAYHIDNGSYPAKLADLKPKYLAEIPKDIFNDADLHYKQEGDGYLLYSVGVNGRDDGGKSYDDDTDHQQGWDDLVIRIPAAEYHAAK